MRKHTIRVIAISILLASVIGFFVIRKTGVEVRRRRAADAGLRQLNEELESKIVEHWV